ncbi:hypothetical protein H351_31290 (plasmid) [Rhodococcus erythropolis R138]|uniref:hypothetical protein n=1 Tax=Rhodococcus erythropolis TaxID=1833 RepID=UPI000492B4A4|nr:hypothetical protein [Rhodococcus erythropolis]ALU73719.1 hypothetical protein H351_31290 [Rhodococcus erythropolis R138]
MDAVHTVALMAVIPMAGVAVFAIGGALLGRRARSLRRQGRLHYSARTTPGSDVSSNLSM